MKKILLFMSLAFLFFVACEKSQPEEAQLRGSADMSAEQYKIWYDQELLTSDAWHEVYGTKEGTIQGDTIYSVYANRITPYAYYVEKDSGSVKVFYLEEVSESLSNAQIAAEVDTMWINRESHTYTDWHQVIRTLFD